MEVVSLEGGVEAIAKAERDRIVMWLQETARTLSGITPGPQLEALLFAANNIEANNHRQEKQNG